VNNQREGENMNMTHGGTMPDDLLLSVYGALAGLNDMPVTVLEGTRDEARGRYAQEIVARGLLDTGCQCEVCEAVRADALLMGLDP
jgi:hypothetical protein